MAIVIAAGGPAAAQDNPVKPDLRSLSDAEIATRLQFLEQRLDSEQTAAQIWQYGWTAFNGGAMIGEAVIAGTTTNRKDRDSSAVQSVEGLIGVIGLMMRPLPAQFGSDPVRSMPDATRDDHMNQLSAAEDLIQRGAERADAPYQLMPQLGVFGINLLGGVAIWKMAGLTHAYQAVIPGIILGELQLWTIPQSPADDLKDYRTLNGRSSEAPIWQLSAMPGGLQISARF